MPSPHGACPYMHLRCVNCRQPVALPDGFDRYFDMPVRCHACRRVFTVPPQRPGDNATSDGQPERPLDRSVSARRHHHAIRCEACAVTLGLPGSRTPEMAVDLVCPACGAGFRHRRRRGGRHSLIPIAGIMMLVLGLILLAQAKGYIELRNLASTPALVWVGEILDRLGLR